MATKKMPTGKGMPSGGKGTMCAACGGSGRKNGKACASCGGSGKK